MSATSAAESNAIPAYLPLRNDLIGEEPYGAPQLDVPVCLNVNENPYAPEPAVVETIAQRVKEIAPTLNRYPDREHIELRKAFSKYLERESGVRLEVDQLWGANGSNEIMLQLFQAFGGPGRTALGCDPTYSMYPEYARDTFTTWKLAHRNADFTLDVDATIKAEGERAVFETNIHGLHPELIKLLGRMKYRTSYGQNVLNHSIEVSHIAGLLASELGVDVATAKRAGLLHDIGKAIDHEVEGSHVTIGVNIARKYKESEEVIHAIEAHHNDVEPHTVVACLVQAADAISAARPGARRENIENYVKRLEKLEEVTKSFPGIANCFAIQAGREIRIMVKPEEVSEDQMVLLARDIAKKIEDELTYPGQIKVNLMRETKAVDYAK